MKPLKAYAVIMDDDKNSDLAMDVDNGCCLIYCDEQHAEGRVQISYEEKSTTFIYNYGI